MDLKAFCGFLPPYPQAWAERATRTREAFASYALKPRM